MPKFTVTYIAHTTDGKMWNRTYDMEVEEKMLGAASFYRFHELIRSHLRSLVIHDREIARTEECWVTCQADFTLAGRLWKQNEIYLRLCA